MSENQGVSPTDIVVKAASDEAKSLLAHAFKSVSDANGKGHSSDTENPRLFFPNGIELIDVKVEFGLTEKTKVTVEVRIAGEKGAKGSLLDETSTGAVVIAEE